MIDIFFAIIIFKNIRGRPLRTNQDFLNNNDVREGEQRKPQISLEDCVQSISNAVQAGSQAGMQIKNQTTEVVSIIDLASYIQKSAKDLGVSVEINHVPNPRVEKEEHAMAVDTENFRKLLPVRKHTVSTGALQTLRSLLPYKAIIAQYKDRFMSN